ncbi:hypothetical protein M2164_008421 [Streptomyces sp. SAI-208]|uniref:hypothetical protein n=1 Tax=Streptomyces sp. SAI-208 TaxID=2940550 RepID=UPI002476A3E0|nr:hypothetical protein [Streptomyces sp. SAI-208]MDH6612786.1 hypothetical protein [Streptomyces sp. SAI-208]
MQAILDAAAVRAATNSHREDFTSGYKAAAQRELDEARAALGHSAHAAMRSATHVGVAQSHLDAVQNLIIWLASDDDVKAMLPQMVALADEHLSSKDPRRLRVKEIEERVGDGADLTLSDRGILAETTGLARRMLRKETLRVRSFARVVGAVSGVMLAIAVVVAFFAFKWPDTVPLCFTPEDGGTFSVVCPTESVTNIPHEPNTSEIRRAAKAQDYLVVASVGAVAASVASAAALRRMRGTSLPYNVPLVLAALKLPTGALTALLGLLLMRGGFVPGLSALDSSAQVIGWAIVFGYSQQLFTKFVDSQGQSLLDSVRGPGSPPLT